jgi:hypothetical protein
MLDEPGRSIEGTSCGNVAAEIAKSSHLQASAFGPPQQITALAKIYSG